MSAVMRAEAGQVPVRALQRIHAIQQAIGARRELPEVLHAIVEAACELIGCDQADLRVTHPVSHEEFHLRGGSLPVQSWDDPAVGIPAPSDAGWPGDAGWPSAPRATVARPVLHAGEVVGELVLQVELLPGRPADGADGADGAVGEADADGDPPGLGGETGTLATVLADLAAIAVQDAVTASALRQAVDHVRHQASHDSLTGVSNRDHFLTQLDACLPGPPDSTVAVLLVDIDDFKAINDSRGHLAGDRLLALVAERLLGVVRPTDQVARIGGDEFAVLIRGVADEEHALDLATRIHHALENRADLFGHETWVSTSIGVALPEPGDDAGGVLARADLALEQAKREGRGRVCPYDPLLADALRARVDVETQLRRALAEGEIIVYLQPIVDLSTGLPAGLEALARWNHPERGVIPPAHFIPVAEQTGLIVELGRQVLDQACWAAARLRAACGLPLRLNVNVSPRQIDDTELPQVLARALAETGLPPDDITLEVTESLLLADGDQVEAAMAGLVQVGVRLALDDFGTGYSSLNTLRRLPVKSLKIDRSFVAHLGEQTEASRMAGGADEGQLVQAVIGLGLGLGMSVVAEGVETEPQRAQLVAMGCTLAQGYLLARPMPEEAALAWLLAATRPGLPERPATATRPPRPRDSATPLPTSENGS